MIDRGLKSTLAEGDPTVKIELARHRFIDDIFGAGQDIEDAKLSDVANTMAVRIPAASSKQTTPNPKCLALQQGYNGLTKKSYVQVSEPILLDT